MSSELPCISMNLTSLARYSSGIQSPVSTCPPDWTYSRNSCVRVSTIGLPTERSLASSIWPRGRTSSRARPPALRRARLPRHVHGRSSPRRSASRRARSTRSPARSRSSCSRRCARARARSTPRSTRFPRTRRRSSAIRLALRGHLARRRRAARRRDRLHAGVALPRGRVPRGDPRRAAPLRGALPRALPRRASSRGELRTDLDAGAAALLVLSAANWAYTWLDAGTRHRRARRPLHRDPRRRHPRLRDAPVTASPASSIPGRVGSSRRRLAAVRAALPRRTELRMTSAGGEATEIAREVSGRVDALYVFGGDGTYNEVLNGIDADYAARLHPRRRDERPAPCARASRTTPLRPRGDSRPGRTRRIGVGRVNGRRFGFACGIGLDAEVVRAVDELGRRSDGRRPSKSAFAWTGLRTLGRHRFQLEPALEVVGHGRAAFALVSNGPAYSYAGSVALRPAPHASFEGGLDLVAPVRLRARELPRLAWYALGRGKRATARDLAVRARRRPDRDRSATADAARGRRRGSRRRRARRHRGRARRRYRASSDHAGCGRRRIRTAAKPPSAATSDEHQDRANDLPRTSRTARCPVGAFSGRPTATSLSSRASETATNQPPRVRSVVQKG